MRPESPVLPPEPPPSDPFPYGYRYVKRERPDGTIDFDQVPLTLEDVLHPQEEDVIPQRPAHLQECVYLMESFRSRPFGPPETDVTVDQLIDWGVSGLRPHSPDVAVFVGLREPPDPNKGTLRLAESGGRCLFVVEIVSPDTRNNDAVVKVEHYYRAGVPLYVLIDQEQEGGPRRLVAYRPGADRYDPAPLDEQGRLLLPGVGLYLSLRDGRPVCHDPQTGAELTDDLSVRHELEQVERRIEELEPALEDAIERARQVGDERDRAVKEARDLAEARDRALEAQRKAQAAAQEQAKRAEEAEKRLRELEGRLRALQPPPP
jgi:colicin import membrane protein